MSTQDTYHEDIKSFNKISSAKANELLSTKNFVIVYIGRETCPFCRKFAKKLSALAPQINTTIYYVDSNNPLDPDINSFRAHYNIPTVPGFIVSTNSKITVRCDSGMPENEILDLIK